LSIVPKNNLALRLFTALPLIPLLLAVMLIPALSPVFALIVVFLSFMGARELKELIAARQPEITPLRILLLAPLLPLILFAEKAPGPIFFTALHVLLFFLVVEYLLQKEAPLERLAYAIAGLFYIGGLPCFFIELHRIPQSGPGLITFLLVAIGLSDTFAFAFGKMLGKHKLCPAISPNKTVEGSIAGLAGGALVGLMAYAIQQIWHLEGLPGWSPLLYLSAGICLSSVGQIGDLAESALKRSAGVKDSGRLFPGHGGALDRCDAFLFGGPALYCLLLIVGN
jgi:phosphatidate cytidylyltransferase